MALIGVCCASDGSYQTFDSCIKFHEEHDVSRNCHAPVFVIKDMRDNAKKRKGAGISVSTLLSCVREHAIMQRYDWYEPIIQGYNKSRGSWLHAMFEADPDPPEWVLREKRLIKFIDVGGVQFRISGQFDEFDTKYGILVDYKSKDNLPTKSDPKHEMQFNCYASLLRGGIFLDTGEPANYEVKIIAAHYVTWKTKTEKAWLKMGYPLWEPLEIDNFILSRAKHIVEWEQTGIIPSCNNLTPSPYWLCGCAKLEIQLAERGIIIE